MDTPPPGNRTTSTSGTGAPRRVDAASRWQSRVSTLTIVTVVGYLSIGRAFAYIGVPALGIFLGEVLLVGAFAFRPLRDRVLAVVGQLVDPGPFHILMWAIAIFVGYGLFQVVLGHSQGHPLQDIILNLPFNYYAIFVPVGIAIGTVDRGILRRFVAVLAWTNAIYGAIFLLFLQHLGIVLPWAQGVALSGPAGSGIAIMGLLCLGRSFRRDWYLYVANFFMMLAMQMRGEWVGFMAALVIWSILKRNLRVMAGGAAIVAVAFTIMSLFNLQIPASSTRGGKISAQGVLARSVAPFNKDLAMRYSDQADVFAGTASWRQTWWNAIGDSVTKDRQHLLFGNGYGFELRNLVAYVEPGVRTPHSVYYYAIGYSGFVGLAFFAGLQIAILGLLQRVRRVTGEVFGFTVVALGFGLGMFGNYFETPFGAIPYYVLLGLCLSPLATTGGASRRSSFAVSGPVATRYTSLGAHAAPSAEAPGAGETSALEPPVDGFTATEVEPQLPGPALLELAVTEVDTSRSHESHVRWLNAAKDRLQTMSASELRALARAQGVRRPGAMKKSSLIALLEAEILRDLDPP